MEVEQRERNYNSSPAVSFSSPVFRTDDSTTHSRLCSSVSSSDGRSSSSSSSSISISSSVSTTKILASTSSPFSRMDEVSQACIPSVASTDTYSDTRCNACKALPSSLISSCPPRSQSPDDDNSSCSMCNSSTSSRQSRPTASHSLDNSEKNCEPSSSFHAVGNSKHSSFPKSCCRACSAQTASNSSGSSGRDKDKDIGEVQVTFGEDGQIKGSRSSTEFQPGQMVPFLGSPAGDPVYSATDMLLAEWNGSPFVSSYHGHNGELQGEENESEEASSHDSPWHIDISKVELGEMVASGSYGMVYKGLYKDEKVAVKMLLIPESSSTKESQKLKSGFRQEIDVWYTLNHPNIVQFIGAYITPPRWAIVTEFLHGGSLRAYLARQQWKKLPQRIIQAMALDIARGMEYLHQNNIMHRDLKSANLLLDASGRVKVADFGLARFETKDPGNLTAETGTIRWMAPEVICHMTYNRKIDVYSFGIVLWELCTSQLPFEGMSFVQLAHAVANDNHRPPTSEVSSSTFTKLMTRCWDKDSLRRPDFTEIVQYLETGYSANLEPKMKPRSFTKPSSRSSKGKSMDKYSRPTISMHGGHVVSRRSNTGAALVANRNDELTDEEEWLNVRRQCRCTIV